MTEPSDVQPYGVQVYVCSLCGQPWEKHLGATLFRLQLDGAEDWPSDEELEQAVSTLECIHLLKVANQGPIGPPGVQGPMGIQGAPG